MTCNCLKVLPNICRRWLLRITEYGIVRQQSVYNDLVMTYVYCDTLLRRILYLCLWADMGYFAGLVVLSICLTWLNRGA